MFFKPRKHVLLSFPTPILPAEKNQRLSKGYFYCVKSVGLRGVRILYTAIWRYCCPFQIFVYEQDMAPARQSAPC